MTVQRFGPWRPDAAGLDVPLTAIIDNLVPVPSGFAPVGGLASGTGELPADPIGAAIGIAQNGAGVAFAGTAPKLYKLNTVTNAWDDVTRVTGGDYGTGSGERWRFVQFTNADTVGDLVITTNSVDPIQKFNLSGGTNFEDLGGNPPLARFIGRLGQFLLLGDLTGVSPKANRVQWCDVQNPESWAPGTGSLAGFQDLPQGGPVTGILSGDTAYIFQRDRITRQIFVPGAPEIMQFDEVESGIGMEAVNSLVQVGALGFYLGRNGFYAFDTVAGRSIPIGEQKVDDYFAASRRANTRLNVYGGADPVSKRVFWAYISVNNTGAVPDKVIIYDWGLQEWGFATIDVLALSEFITQGFNLDELTSAGFGDLDSLPFSLDSPFWAGGKSILGIFGTNRRLSNLTGAPLAAELETREFTGNDANQRLYLQEIAPIVDAQETTVAVGVKERKADNFVYGPATGLERTGFCPVHKEGRFFTIRVNVPAGADWTLAEGADVQANLAGTT